MRVWLACLSLSDVDARLAVWWTHNGSLSQPRAQPINLPVQYMYIYTRVYSQTVHRGRFFLAHTMQNHQPTEEGQGRHFQALPTCFRLPSFVNTEVTCSRARSPLPFSSTTSTSPTTRFGAAVSEAVPIYVEHTTRGSVMSSDWAALV